MIRSPLVQLTSHPRLFQGSSTITDDVDETYVAISVWEMPDRSPKVQYIGLTNPLGQDNWTASPRNTSSTWNQQQFVIKKNGAVMYLSWFKLNLPTSKFDDILWYQTSFLHLKMSRYFTIKRLIGNMLVLQNRQWKHNRLCRRYQLNRVNLKTHHEQ